GASTILTLFATLLVILGGWMLIEALFTYASLKKFKIKKRTQQKINKIALKIAPLIITLALASLHKAYASDLSIRLEQPERPNSQEEFNITFVALDIQNRQIVVDCFVKESSEVAFTKFGDSITLQNGGDTGNCRVTSNILS